MLYRQKLIYGFITRKYKRGFFWQSRRLFFFFFWLLSVYYSIIQKLARRLIIKKMLRSSRSSRSAAGIEHAHVAMRSDDRWRQVMEPITGSGVKTTTKLLFQLLLWNPARITIFSLHLHRFCFVSPKIYFFLCLTSNIISSVDRVNGRFYLCVFVGHCSWPRGR